MIRSSLGVHSLSFSISKLGSEAGIEHKSTSVLTVGNVGSFISNLLQSGEEDLLASFVGSRLWELHGHVLPNGLSGDSTSFIHGDNGLNDHRNMIGVGLSWDIGW